MSRVFEALRQTQDRSRENALFVHTMPNVPEEPIDFEAVEHVQARLSPEARLIVHTEPQSLAADRYRLLRAHFRELHTAGKIKTVLVTSARPREGKSTTALNLAAGLVEHGKYKVVLVEGDFRHPSLPERLGLPPWPALVRCLQEDRNPVSALRCVDPLGFYLLPAGEAAQNPVDLLSSERFSRTLSALRGFADWVIIDGTPVDPVPDMLTIKSKADGCLWVLKAGSTPRDVVDECVRQVGKPFLLGMVLNGLDGLEGGYSTYYGYRST